MESSFARPHAGHTFLARRREPSEDSANAKSDTALAREALAYAVHCHAGQRRSSDGAQFIEHSLEVARLLRDAGCSAVLIAAGLLHDVLEDTTVPVAELTLRFGVEVADLVQAVSDDAADDYRQRKQAQRERVRTAGADAALLFAADKIAKVRELPSQVARDRAQCSSSPRHSRAHKQIERYNDQRLEHYRESLGMLQGIHRRHPLIKRLANELDACEHALARGATGLPS
jgi:(p)ppGpp synthase/HD superfamily hydrolase